MTQFTAPPNKYKAKREGKYASRAEARRAGDLKLLERAGKIENLGEQVKFEIVPEQRDAAGKLIERAVHYIADFVYTDRDGNEVVEDCKGFRTDAYIIKRKLMLHVHGVAIHEVA